MRTLVLTICLFATVAFGQQKKFETLVGDTEVGVVEKGAATQVPYITWGGDVPTFMANGGLSTTPESIYGKSGLNLKLVAGDDFQQQVRDYLKGKSPYLRGTTHMMGLASELLNKTPATKPVVLFQLTWSAGDHIVSRENIKTLNDLRGKKIVLQQGGPHLGLLDDSLKAAGLSWDNITVVWAKDLTASDSSPAEMMRKDPSIDAACVITPDMIGLCSGLESKGSGAEGTIKGSHVVNSTASMSRSIADVYVCREDYFKSNKAEVEKFVAGYFKATDDLLKAKKDYNDGQGKSPPYIAALKLAQKIFGETTLPTIEEDAHGLISDANFVRIPGNETFFTDQGNLDGFETKQKSALDLAVKLGYCKERFGFLKPNWDFKKLSEDAGIAYTAPVISQGRIKAEITDFTTDLDENTILSFTIQFEPEQASFPVESYGADFQRVVQNASTFGNAVVLIRGHSDPTLALQHFFLAAQAKGLITGTKGAYKFKGQDLDLARTGDVISAIQQEPLSGQKRKTADGQLSAIPDPKQTVAAAQTLSYSRAAAVKETIETYAKGKKLNLDLSQIQLQGVGISEPVKARPTSLTEAKENMRVEFRVVKVKAEALSGDDFNFDR